MIYIEDSLAAVIRCAAEYGKIPSVTPDRVYTDETAANEWEGEDKVYVLRGAMTPIYDVTSFTGNSELGTSEIALISISGSRDRSQRLAAAVWAAAGWKLGDYARTEEYEGEYVDFFDELKDLADLVQVSEDDRLQIGAQDSFKATALNAHGEISGTGELIAGVVFGTVPTPRFRTQYLGIGPWIHDRSNAVPRRDNGSFRDQWCTTTVIRVIHSI